MRRLSPPVVSWLLIACPLFAGSPALNGHLDDPKTWTAIRGISFADNSVQHQGHKSLVLQPLDTSDGLVKSPSIPLTMGKRYEVSAYVKTEALEAIDNGRTPIATGASLSMASMPWDVHSESVGGTHDWARLKLRFIATRAEDNIVLKVAEGASFRGKAWFEGVSIDEVSVNDTWPSKAALRTYGPAYRYPQGGWIYLHVEGDPYERGYQHGTLMAKEIPQYLERTQADYDPQFKDWKSARNTANSLFLRGFDQEILEEMKGIADGASDAGSKFLGRRIDLIDIVTANTIVEMGELRAALPMTPSGLEALHLTAPKYQAVDASGLSRRDRCSAFAATGKATKDGKMLIAHTTWWPLTLAEQSNVMLDIKPTKGHRVLMQSYPGGIESGTDWYQNDVGVVLTETTIRQTPFNSEGTPVAYRARKAIQYGDDIDGVVQHLSTKNNGLYTNEWLIGDAKNNEVAMFELGTNRTKLWRSSKNEWFGGTEGFYWGCNNAKDLNIRLEYLPDPKGTPEHVPYVATERDLKWQQMYAEYKGRIDEQFAFLAFRTAPLVSGSAMDAKVVTAAMAAKMMVWGVFGKPNEREWVPSEMQKQSYAKNDGLYSSGYRLFTVDPPAALKAPVAAKSEQPPTDAKAPNYRPQLWKGWILPATPADTWLSAGAVAYYYDLQSGDLAQAMAAHWAGYRLAKGDGALVERSEIDRHNFETHRGAILLDSLRKGLGDERFFAMMRAYFDTNTTQRVSAQTFLDQAGTTATMPLDKGGPEFLVRDVMRRLSSALIVYGTVTDASANRYAAEQLQKQYLSRYESAVLVRKDFEVSDADLQSHDVVFVGRPETNSALAGMRKQLDLDFEGGAFRLNNKDHASETEALLLAAANPLDSKRMVLLVAGNSALATVKAVQAFPANVEYSILDAGSPAESGFRIQSRATPPVETGFAKR